MHGLLRQDQKQDQKQKRLLVGLLVAIALTILAFLSLPTYVLAEKQTSQPADEAAKTTSTAESESEKVVAKTSGEFTLPEGLTWKTNNTDPVFSDPKAKIGGTYFEKIEGFPATFRRVGPNSNSAFRRYLGSNQLSLTHLHPNTKNHIPVLATHWAVASDLKTVYYKLNTKAKWSDGSPVTAEDYTFILEFMRSPHITAPWYNQYYSEEIADIKIHAPDVISVVSGKKHMEYTLLNHTGLSPLHRGFHKLDKNWVKNYNWKIEPTTGPYYLSSFKHGKFVTLKRKKNWWGNDLRYFKNTYNFEKQHLKVIRDPEAQWQSFLAGELTAFDITLPSYWHNKATGGIFEKGYVKKLWFYNDIPHGTGTIYMNTTREPWDNLLVRKAFSHALNFDKVNSQLLKQEYERLPSFTMGYDAYNNPEIRAREFSIEKATAFMKQAGWSLTEDGFWQKDGKKLEAKLLYRKKIIEDQLILLKEEAKKAGFDLVLNFQQATAAYKQIMEKNYDLAWVGFNIRGSVPPPKYWEFFHSVNAKTQSNNLSMTKNPELDKLIDLYRDTFDESTKQELSRKILQIIHDEAAVIPGLIYPFDRVAYWRYIKLPKVPGTKQGPKVFRLGWVDDKAKKELEEYQKQDKSLGRDATVDETFRAKK